MNESQILAQYDKLAHKVAQKYHAIYKARHEYEDIYQAARLGVLEAARTFDSNKSTSFVTHAYNCARYSVSHHLRADTGVIKMPYRVDQAGGEEKPMCVEMPENWAETAESDGDSLTDAENRYILEAAMQHLTANQRELMEMVYFEQVSMDEVAAHFKISRPTAYSWHNKAVEKLRGLMEARNIEFNDLFS